MELGSERTVFQELELLKANKIQPCHWDPTANSQTFCLRKKPNCQSEGLSSLELDNSDRYDSGLGGDAPVSQETVAQQTCMTSTSNLDHTRLAVAPAATEDDIESEQLPRLIVPSRSYSDDEGVDMDEGSGVVEKDSVSVAKQQVVSSSSKPVPRKPKVDNRKKLASSSENNLLSARRQHANNKKTTKTAKLSRSESLSEKPAKKKNKKVDESATTNASVDISMELFLPNSDGDNGLHLCVIHQKNDLLKRLVDFMYQNPVLREIMGDQNKLQQTPLHLAVHTQQTEMVNLLLAFGPSSLLSARDHKGNTALTIACRQSSPKCIDEIVGSVLSEVVAEASRVINNNGQSCVHVAVSTGNTRTLGKLYEAGVDIDMKELRGGKTALHLAAEANAISMVQFLLETCVADVNVSTYSGVTPLHIAASNGSLIMVAYLLSMGADPELLTDEGDSPLGCSGSDDVHTLLTKAAAMKWL